MLNEVQHGFSAQKNEALSEAISRVAPKDKTFSKSLSLDNRVAWVIAVDSVGYLDAFSKIAKLIGLDAPCGTVHKHLLLMDKKREADRVHQTLQRVNQERGGQEKGDVREECKRPSKQDDVGYRHCIGTELTCSYYTTTNMEPRY
jgi:hypothetical protein